ncbi:MAG TPA: hexose kinase [Candidatus Dormibacteraeota bacterium]|nr:hexose kinase [Candidatus Dormibacteraeota bacterium]
MSILCIGATPAAQRVMVFQAVTVGAVNRAVATHDGAAGKAVNVAKVLKILGEDPILIGLFGGQRGKDLQEQLCGLGIQTDSITVPAETRLCTTIIDQGQAVQTELVEESKAVEAAIYEELIAIVRTRAKNCPAAIMSGTLTPGAPASFYARCVGAANENRALSIVDARGPALLEALPVRPGVVKPNRAELAATVGGELSTDKSLGDAMRALHERGAQRVIITAGADPVMAFDGQRFWRITAPRVTTVNPIGSGDAFTAGLTIGLLRGDELGEACRLASAAGAANALSLMPGELELKDVKRLAGEVKVEQISPE